MPALDGEPVLIEHNLLEKSINEGGASHKVYLTAHGRVVEERDIGLAMGLTTYIEKEGAKYVYAGVISGKLLDDNVNSERTAFDLNDDQLDAITRPAIEKAQEVLAPQINRVIERQAELTRSVLRKYPRFSYLVGDARTFVEDVIPRNLRTAEQVYQRLAVEDFRENRDLERQVDSLSRKEGSDADDVVSKGVASIVERMTNQEFSVLADYTVRRKVVLDLLDKRLGFKPDGSMKSYSEEALHEFVVPMRVENADVHIDKHNLWIIDDKLTYYEHWSSDRQLKKTIEESESKVRPDVLLFGGRTIFHRPDTDQPVVIIELKKPNLNNYDDEKNPFTQIYSYIEEMREGKAVDRFGATIQEISPTTPFFCYIVADLTRTLRAQMRMAQINVPLPGGGAFYGYNDDYKALVQVLSYKYVLKDARLRNEAFFKRLCL